MLEPASLSGHKDRGVRGQLPDAQGFGGASACPPGIHSKAKVVWITQAKPPTWFRIVWIMIQFVENTLPGPRPQLLLQNVSPRIAQRKK